MLASGLGLIAATYGLVRLALGLFLPDVQRDLGFGADVAGAVSSGASLLYCCGAVAGFLFAARAARPLLVVAATVAGAGALGSAASPSTAVFAVSAVVASAGAGIASPALVQVVASRVREDRRDGAQAVVNSGTGPGLVVAGLLALLLLPDWRTAWAASGVATLAVGAVLVAATGRLPRTARTALPGRRWVAAHALPVIVALLFGAGTSAVWTYGRSVLVDAGLPTAVTVGAWIAIGVGGAAVALTARWLSGRTAPLQWVLTSGAAALAVLVVGIVPGSVPAALGACLVFGWGYTAATGALIAWTTRADPEHAAAGTSVLFVVLVAGQALGAALAGAVVGTVGTAGTFAAAAVVCAVAAGAAVLVPRRSAVTA